MNIANVVLHDFTHDNRVLKTSIALMDVGHEVTVVALHRNQLPGVEYHPARFRIERVRIYVPGFRVLSPLKQFGLGARVVNDTPEGWYEALAEAESKSPAWKVQAIDGTRQAQAALNWENESHGLTAIYERLQLQP